MYSWGGTAGLFLLDRTVERHLSPREVLQCSCRAFLLSALADGTQDLMYDPPLQLSPNAITITSIQSYDCGNFDVFWSKAKSQHYLRCCSSKLRLLDLKWWREGPLGLKLSWPGPPRNSTPETTCCHQTPSPQTRKSLILWRCTWYYLGYLILTPGPSQHLLAWLFSCVVQLVGEQSWEWWHHQVSCCLTWRYLARCLKYM